MKIPVNSITTLFAMLLVMVCGCATFDYQNPAPAQKQKIAINVLELGFKDKNVPTGVYRVPNSAVIVSGHQGEPGSASAFGLLGMLAYVGSRSAKGKAMVGDAKESLDFRLKDQIIAALTPLLRTNPSKRYFTLEAAPGSPELIIDPAVVLTYISSTEVIPSVAVKVTLSNAGKKTWAQRYFCPTGSARPLDGPNGWTENDSTALSDALQASLDKLVPLMLDDIREPLPRDPAKKVTVTGHLPFRQKRCRVIGYNMAEDTDYLIFNPCNSDYSINSGINILRKDAIKFRPTNKDDKEDFVFLTQ